jgi:hypothetical protein
MDRECRTHWRGLHTGFWFKNLKQRGYKETQKYSYMEGNSAIDLRDIGFIWLRIEKTVGSCEDGNKTSVSIRFWEFVARLSDSWVLKKDSASWR